MATVNMDTSTLDTLDEVKPAVKLRSPYFLSLVMLFVFSFMFFLYLTFPFGVLKEAITAGINKSSAFQVHIGSLSPNFPIGLDARDVQISKAGSPKILNIARVSVELGVLSLLMGTLRVDMALVDKKMGQLGAQINMGLFSLLTGSATLPKYIELNAAKYPVDGVFDFALGLIDLGPSYQQFFGPILEKVGFQGTLNGQLQLKLNASEPTSSVGFVDLSLQNGSFEIAEPNLNIDQQIFSKFLIKAKMEKGEFKLDDKMGLTSQDLDLGIKGSVVLKQKFDMSELNAEIRYKMQGSLQTQIGGLLDPFLGGTNGEATIKLSGPLVQIRKS